MASDTSGVVRTPQQDRSRRAVRRLLDAAEAAFAEQGYERASVRDIAARAEVPKGSLYQFFRNKEALLDAVVADLIAEVDDIYAGLDAIDVDPGPSGRSPLESMVDHVIGRVLDLAARRPAFRTLFSGLSAAGPLADAGAQLRERYRSHIEAVMVRADPPSPVGYAQVSTVCTEIARGLLPCIVDERGHVDGQLAPELSHATTAYLSSVKARSGPR
ncbi:MAG: TetR/AcrR family transcriptional regulator [Actinomycetota bacterium]